MKPEDQRGVIINHGALEPDTLRRIIEEYITREGTDYGHQEFSIDSKVAQVKKQLEKGEAHLVYDEQSESCTISRKR